MWKNSPKLIDLEAQDRLAAAYTSCARKGKLADLGFKPGKISRLE